MVKRNCTTLLLGLWLAGLAGPTLAGKGGGKPPQGDPPADPAIAFFEDGDLVVINEDGSNRTVVLSGVTNSVPSWSPDGSQIAFASDVQGPGVYVINVDGTGLRKVTSRNSSSWRTVDWSPDLAPDGRYKIAFIDVPAAAPTGNPDLFLVNMDGTERVNLTNTPDRIENAGFTWSPDGERIAVQAVSGSDVTSSHDILVLDLGLVDGVLQVTRELNLTADADVPGGLLNDADVGVPSWAKTKDIIVVVVTSAALNGGSDLSDLWIMDLADPANPFNITNSPSVAEVGNPFSSDDMEVAFLSDDLKPAGLYAVAADGSGAVRRLYKGRASRPAWRRNP